jgi:hypothetical protein
MATVVMASCSIAMALNFRGTPDIGDVGRMFVFGVFGLMNVKILLVLWARRKLYSAALSKIDAALERNKRSSGGVPAEELRAIFDTVHQQYLADL